MSLEKGNFFWVALFSRNDCHKGKIAISVAVWILQQSLWIDRLACCSFGNFTFCSKRANEFIHTEICGKKESLAIMMTCVSPAVVIFDFNPSYYVRRCRWCRHRHTVTVVINETIFFLHEINAKRNRIAVEKAIQQKSLVFSPPVSATTTLTTHTHTNTNTNANTPETDFNKHGHSVSIMKFDAMFVGHSIPWKGAYSKRHKRMYVVCTTTIGISIQLNFIRNFIASLSTRIHNYKTKWSTIKLSNIFHYLLND